MIYDTGDWYWQLPEHIYSSRSDAFVRPDYPDYKLFCEDGNIATVIGSDEELAAVLSAAGICYTPTEERKALREAMLIDANLQLLWRSATDYQERYISGAAIGLLTIGVMQQKPKSLVIMGWINAVWALYYSRKPLVTATAVDTDFSAAGPMPYSVPELQIEVMP